MTDKKLRNTRLTNALLWAAAFIGTALILKGTPYADKVFLLMLVLSTTSVLSFGGGSDAKEELRCVARRLKGKSAD